jgi:hypothetical protein
MFGADIIVIALFRFGQQPQQSMDFADDEGAVTA